MSTGIYIITIIASIILCLGFTLSTSVDHSVKFYKNQYTSKDRYDMAKNGDYFKKCYRINLEEYEEDGPGLYNYRRATYDGHHFIALIFLGYILYRPLDWLYSGCDTNFCIISPLVTWYIVFFLIGALAFALSKNNYIYQECLWDFEKDGFTKKGVYLHELGNVLGARDGIFSAYYLWFLPVLTICYRLSSVLFIIAAAFIILFIHLLCKTGVNNFDIEFHKSLHRKYDETVDNYEEWANNFSKEWEQKYKDENEFSKTTFKHGFDACKSKEDAKILYKKLMKENHPDNGGSEEVAAEITYEYNLLLKHLS